MAVQPHINYAHSIAGDQLIALWESRRTLRKSSWALSFLSAVLPEIDYESLSKARLGDRDSLLMIALRKYFAPRVSMSGQCPECQEDIEVSFLPEELGYPDKPTLRPSAYSDQDVAGHNISIRPLCSEDLELGQTHKILYRVCQFKDGASVDEDRLSSLSEKVDEIIADLDPLADIGFDLSCGICDAVWEELFDPVEVIATQIDVRAPRLLEDIAVLARYYGWSERDILNMSFPRRDYYLRAMSA